jgi:hypothetical protein
MTSVLQRTIDDHAAHIEVRWTWLEKWSGLLFAWSLSRMQDEFFRTFNSSSRRTGRSRAPCFSSVQKIGERLKSTHRFGPSLHAIESMILS